MFLCKWMVVAVLVIGYGGCGTEASVCPAAPFRPSSSPGVTVTTPCSSVHPSLNPRGVITWQCLPDFTWEGDWSGCTFPEGVVHAVAPLAYRVAAGASEVNNSIQAIVSEVQALLQSVSLETFGDIYVAYIGPGGDFAETLLVLMLQVDEFFSRSSFQELETTASAENFTLASLLASPVWSGGPALRAYNLCKCPLLWSPLESDLAPGQPIVYLCTTPSYIEGTCSCQDLLNSTTCSCSPAFSTNILSALGRVCLFREPPLPQIQSVMVTPGFQGTSPDANPSLEVSWEGVGDPAIGYVVKYISSAGPPTEPPAGARELATNDINVTLADNLAEDKRTSYRYYVWVAARSAGVTGEYSERASADTLSSPVPSDVTVFPAGCQSLRVTWTPQPATPPLTLIHYRVCYRLQGGSDMYQFSSAGNSYTITGLAPATSYSVTVVAQTQLGYGNYCCLAVASTENVAPPRMVTLEPLASQGAIRVTWSPPADLCGLTNPQYIIQYGVTESSFTTHPSRPSSSPFTITGLTTGQQYFVRVAILGGAGYFSSWESVTIHEDQVTFLDVKSLSGVTLETGDALVLTCEAGTDSSQATYFDVVWRINGSTTFSSTLTGFSNVTNKHYLQVDPVLGSHWSGSYSCELRDDAAVNASLDVTVNPGCAPHVFVPYYTPVGQHLEVPCSQAHPSLRGVMLWKCVYDITWDGELSGCTFEEDVDREVGLLYFVFSGNETVVGGKMSGILAEVTADVNQTFYPAMYSFHTVNISRVATNRTLVVFALELRLGSASPEAFTALYMYWNNIQYLGGLATTPYRYADALLTTPSNTCSCPIFYRDIRTYSSDWLKKLQFCKGPGYIKTPCLCTPFLSLSADGCNCSGVYTVVESMDGNMMCAEDTDGDGIPNSEDLCEGCCLEESSEGFIWPTVAHGLESRESCALLHPTFNEKSYVRRRCSDKGKWMPIDVTQCVFKEAATFAVVIVVATVGATKEDIQMQAGDLTSQILSQFASYSPRNASISRYSPGTTGNQTVVTLFVEFPQDVVDDVIRVYSRQKRELQIQGTPFVYGFRPANECTCIPPGEEANLDTLIEVCNGSPLSPCQCTVTSGCKCLDPFVSVNTSSDPHVKCSLDSDGDRIPDHLDAEPFRYNSEVPTQEGCLAAVAQSCPVDTTSSPDISWSETPPCVYDVQRCSTLLNETVGLAYRLCDQSGMWEEPDVRDCQSVAFRNIETTVSEVVTAILDTPAVTEGGTLSLQPSHITLLANTTQTLLNATAPSSSSSGLLPGDLNTAVHYLNSLASISEASNLFSSANYTETNLFSVTSNILGEQNEGSWEAITSTDNTNTNAAVSLFNSTERLTQSFAQNLSPGESANFTSDNLLIEAWSVSSVSVQGLNVDEKETNNASVFISEELLSQQDNGTAVVVSFVNRLSNRLPQRIAMRSLDMNDRLSVIVSVQVGNITQLSALGNSAVRLQFESQDISDGKTVSCVFLDVQNDPEMSAMWSDAGLVTNHSRAGGVVTCTVHHLTGFAVLVSTAQVGDNHRAAFNVVSYIGCAISLLCLIATIIFLLTLRREILQKLNNFVHLNFCTALACGLLVFLVGIEGAKSVDIACKIMASLIHYFFLAAFFWMLCEVVMMYNLLVKVFHANERKWVYIYLALGWITPLPIVVVSAAIRHEQYLVKDQHSDVTIACWLSLVNGTIFAFIVPMLLILLVNGILLTFVMRSLFKFYRDSRRRQFKADRAGNEAKFLTWELFKAFIILLPLLGFTWIIGLFAVNEETSVFAWIFVVLNSLQGAAIFFFYVLRNDKVRPKIAALFKRVCDVRRYIYHRKVSFAGVTPTESMERLPTSSPDTVRRDLSSLATPTNTLQSSRSEQMHSDEFESHFDTNTDANEEADEMQEAVLTFEDDAVSSTSGSGRKASTISVTLREAVIKSGARYSK